MAFAGSWISTPGVYVNTLQSTVTGCDSTVLLTLSLFTSPQPQIEGNMLVCSGEMTTLTVLEPFAAYLWSDGTSTQTASAAAGVYSVTVTDSNGCSDNDSITVAEWPPVEALWEVASPLCHGGTDGFVELSSLTGGVTPFVFQLNNEAPTTDGLFQNLSAGTWSVLLTDSTGCTTVFNFMLNDAPPLTLDLGEPQWLTEGESYLIPIEINQPGPFSYAWAPQQGLSCVNCPNPLASPSETTTYTLFLQNEQGCDATDSLRLHVRPLEPEVYAPNVFSPDDNGQNDFFTLFGKDESSLQIERLMIYDRWGALLFEAQSIPLNDERLGWDGMARGQKMLPGVYVWLAEIRLANGSFLLKSGDVTLVR